MRAGEQADVLKPEVDLIECAFELRERTELMHPGVDENNS